MARDIEFRWPDHIPPEKRKITDRFLAAHVPIPKPGEPAIRIRDWLTPGLDCRVTSKPPHYHFRARADFKNRSKTVNLTTELGITKAMDSQREAGTILANIKRGKYHIQVGLVTLGQARDRRVQMVKITPRTQKWYLHEFDRFFGGKVNGLRSWLDRPLKDITRIEVQDRHKYITKHHGPSQADQVFETLRSVYRFAMKSWETEALGGFFRPPTDALYGLWNKPGECPPEWTHDEFPIVWNAINEIPNVFHQAWLRLLIFTGMRNEQARQLQWKHIDFDARIISISKEETSKSKDPFLQPMSSYTYDLLLRQRRRVKAKYAGQHVPWVFPTFSRKNLGETTCLQSPSSSYNRISIALGKRFRPHDLRHHFNEVAYHLGLNTATRKQLLNHTFAKNDVTNGTYLRKLADPLRKPIELVAQEFMRRAGLQDVVVPFPDNQKVV